QSSDPYSSMDAADHAKLVDLRRSLEHGAKAIGCATRLRVRRQGPTSRGRRQCTSAFWRWAGACRSQEVVEVDAQSRHNSHARPPQYRPTTAPSHTYTSPQGNRGYRSNHLRGGDGT